MVIANWASALGGQGGPRASPAFPGDGRADDRLRPQRAAGRAAADLPGEGRRRPSVGLEGVVRGYRGGYLPHERRAIERGLRDGAVLAVVSTNALELGIDIGRWTCASWPATPGPWPAPGSRRAGPGGARDVSGAVLVAHTRPRSTSTSSTTPTTSSGADPSTPSRSGQPGHPHEPPQVRGLRVALRRRRATSGREHRAGDPGVPGGARVLTPRAADK